MHVFTGSQPFAQWTKIKCIFWLAAVNMFDQKYQVLWLPCLCSDGEANGIAKYSMYLITSEKQAT